MSERALRTSRARSVCETEPMLRVGCAAALLAVFATTVVTGCGGSVDTPGNAVSPCKTLASLQAQQTSIDKRISALQTNGPGLTKVFRASQVQNLRIVRANLQSQLIEADAQCQHS